MEKGVLGKEYADGEVICRQGEPGDRMFVLQAGRAEVLREEEGTEVVVGELRAGEIFGEMAIIDRLPRSATVRSKGTSRLLTLDKRAYMRRVHEDPTLAFRVLQVMSRRIRALDEELSRLKVFSVKTSSDGSNISYFFVVSPEQPELFNRLSRDFSGSNIVRVISDRRAENRRQVSRPLTQDRRLADRRHQEENRTSPRYSLQVVPLEK